LRGVPHLIWEWDGEVLYSTRDSEGRWCDPVKLSNTKVFAKEPFIEARGDYVKAVWVEEDKKTENGDILMRMKRIDDPPFEWGDIAYIRKTEADARYPQIAGGEYYSWCENDGNKWDVFICSEFGIVENLSNSLFNDQYPQIDYNPDGHLYCGWTKNGRQGSAVALKTLQLGKTRYYTVEGGDSVSSKRLIHRDGITSLSGYPFDYAEDSLVYRLPFIDSTRLFTLKLRGYSGELSQWRDSLPHLTVLIDGQEITGESRLSSIPSVECEIPRELYRGDEEIILTLKPKKNEYVLLSRLSLFDSEISSSHRKGSDKEPENAGVPYYLKVNPNPSRNGRIRIEFGLPTRKKVNLSIYDCTGRRIARLLFKSMEPGVHSISWYGCDKNERQLPSGVYFCDLKTENKRMTKKIVIIR
jgi:hypothetical protein